MQQNSMLPAFPIVLILETEASETGQNRHQILLTHVSGTP